MMNAMQEVKTLVNHLPDNSSIEDVQYPEKNDRGLSGIETKQRGRVAFAGMEESE